MSRFRDRNNQTISPFKEFPYQPAIFRLLSGEAFGFGPADGMTQHR